MTRSLRSLPLLVASLVGGFVLAPAASAHAAGPKRCSLGDGKDTCRNLDICTCPEGEASCKGTGTCELAFGRSFHIGVASVELDERKPNGKCWDAMCGAPDIRVTISHNEKEIVRTSVQKNRYKVRYGNPVGARAKIRQGDGLTITVYDADAAVDDIALVCTVDPIKIETLRARRTSCKGKAGRVTVALSPQ